MKRLIYIGIITLYTFTNFVMEISGNDGKQELIYLSHGDKLSSNS